MAETILTKNHVSAMNEEYYDEHNRVVQERIFAEQQRELDYQLEEN